jgi:bifunctional non-homologous end joining protein LigD
MAASAKTALEIDGCKVTISNAAKVLYPSGFTKGQAIDYYIRVADYLLPYLRGRPLTLKRYPNGVRAPHFYQKDAPGFAPDWLRTFPVPRRTGGEPIHYVVVDNLPSLVWCVNTASLEMHPFLHRVPEIERPTAIVFDLDPGESTGIPECAEVAFLLKEKLAAAGLECFAKVSGSKGMQVYVPLNTTVTYAETQPFARSLAEELESEHPDGIISSMAKKRRTHKVFIDWSQNSDFKTTVAVYSLRAKSEKPYVSLPVTWKEMEEARQKQNSQSLCFEPEAALKRLVKVGDLFAPALSMKQRLRAAGARPAHQRTGRPA